FRARAAALETGRLERLRRGDEKGGGDSQTIVELRVQWSAPVRPRPFRLALASFLEHPVPWERDTIERGLRFGILLRRHDSSDTFPEMTIWHLALSLVRRITASCAAANRKRLRLHSGRWHPCPRRYAG